MDKKKKIIFMGTPSYATVIFEKLLENDYKIVALFTQPDKPVGRKQILTPPHIKEFCLECGLSLPIYQPNSLKSVESVDIIKKIDPDIIIVAAYGQILPKEILDIAPCINLHASLLPKYRGASPIQEAILNDDNYTGVTSMLMDVGLDSGDILGWKYCKIEQDITVDILFDKLANLAALLTLETLENFENIKPKKQNKALVSHCSKIVKNDGIIEFNDAKEIYQKYKAYKFWPGIALLSGLKIKECKIKEIESVNKKGEILDITTDTVVVGCTKGSLVLSMLQPPSKKSMKAVDYLRGSRLGIQDIIN